MKKYTIINAMPVLALVAAMSGCSNSDDAAAPTATAITIPFEAEANGQPINCDAQLTGLGLQDSTATLKDFRFYVHDLSVVTSLGNTRALTLAANAWQDADLGLALVDFQDRADTCGGDAKDTHTSVTGTVPLLPGETVSSLRFRIGVPADANHQNVATAATPLNLSALFWSWQSGYKFMRLDVAPEGGITRPSDETFTGTTWNLHLGSTGCTGDAQAGEDVTCTRPDRPQVVLDDFDPATNHVFLDYAALVAQADLTSDEGGPAGCMSGLTDPECGVIFTALGLDLTTGEVSATPPVFSVR